MLSSGELTPHLCKAIKDQIIFQYHLHYLNATLTLMQDVCELVFTESNQYPQSSFQRHVNHKNYVVYRCVAGRGLRLSLVRQP